MSMYEGHSHHRTPEETGTALTPRQEEFMLAGWHVRPDHHCITDGRQSRQLEPRLMTLLCLLAAQPGDVLNRDDLMESLWPRVVVNENSLTRAVSDLRRVLQDDGTTPFIETVPKKGYKLVAPVSTRITTMLDRPQPAATADGTAGEERSRRGPVMQWLQRHTLALATANVALAVALVSTFSPLVPSTDINTGTELASADRITADAGHELPIEESLREQRGDIIRRDSTLSYPPTMTSARTDSPTSGPDTSGPAVSPDGELVAFTRRTDKGSTLLIGSMLDRSDPLQIYSSQHRIDHLRWSPVGTALLFSVLPTVSHAAMDDQKEGRLMLFDLQDLSVRELYRSNHEPRDTPARFNDALNIT